MGTAIGSIGILGFLVCIIWMLIRLIRRKSVKPAGIGMLVCVILFFGGFGISVATGETEIKKGASAPKRQIEDVKKEGPSKSEDNKAGKSEDFVSTSRIDPEDPPADEHEQARKDFNSSLGGNSPMFYENVRNDVTGRWRLLVCYSTENIVDHAVDYYNAYFESDDEVHIVVNLYLNTTTVINCYSGYLLADVHEYVDKEEHDAKALGGGMLLQSYSVNLSTGETEELSD